MNIKEYLDYVGDEWSRGWLLRGDADHNGIFMPHAYMWICNGNAYEAQLLAQIMYWVDINVSEGKPRVSHMRDGHLWIVKTYDDWAEEMYFNSWTTVRDAMKRLSDKGIIVKETHKSMFHDGNTALFVRPNWEVFGQKIREWGNKPGNTSPVLPEIPPSISGNTSPVLPEIPPSISGNTSPVLLGNTYYVNAIYTENTPKTPEESVEIEKELPRKLGNSFSISPEIGEGEKELPRKLGNSFSPEKGDGEKESNPREKYVKDVLAALSIAKIRFAGTQFQRREQLVEDAIIEFGLREVKKAIQASKKEKARWWSYVATRLRAERKITDVLTGEDYITGIYADYIEH
jgi:hypothetical protein